MTSVGLFMNFETSVQSLISRYWPYVFELRNYISYSAQKYQANQAWPLAATDNQSSLPKNKITVKAILKSTQLIGYKINLLLNIQH